MKKTLLVDGDNLFKIGYHGVRDLYSGGNHIGGVFHFINILRKFLQEHNHDKVVVFWDAEENSLLRKNIYPDYKANRRQSLNDYQYESYLKQKVRVKEYLEEVFVRQCEIKNNEADDLIAHYCNISEDENIIVFSGDKDLTQLISENVKIYSPVSKKYYGYGDKITMNKVDIPHYNVMLTKVFTGDNSDNILGIQSLGEKTLVKYFPEILKKPCMVNEIIDKAKVLSETNSYKSLENILTGKTKKGIIGSKFFETNEKIIDLKKPLLTDEGRQLVEQIKHEEIDPTDRGYKNLMKMMIKDGLFKYLPKDDDAWVNFLRPFMKLIRKEKRKN